MHNTLCTDPLVTSCSDGKYATLALWGTDSRDVPLKWTLRPAKREDKNDSIILSACNFAPEVTDICRHAPRTLIAQM